MIGEADGEPLTRLTSTGIPPPPINLRCGLTLGEGEDGEEGDGKEGRRWTDVEKEEMRDRVKEACDLEVKSQIFGEINCTSCALLGDSWTQNGASVTPERREQMQRRSLFV